MNIPLNEFEQHISETILKRGYNYYVNGHVQPLEFIDNHTIETIVNGSEDYNVKLHLEKEIIKDVFCDCPYDQGVFCKHIVASLLELQSDAMNLTKEKPKKERKKRGKNIVTQIKEILNALTEKELYDLVLETAKENKEFRNSIISKHALKNDTVDLSTYERIIKDLIRTHKGRYGYIEYRSATKIGNEVYKFIEQAAQFLEEEKYENTSIICQAIINVMIPGLHEVDDSSGVFHSRIDDALELLSQINVKKIDEKFRTTLFKYLTQASKKEAFYGWGYEEIFIDIAVELIKTNDERKILEAAIKYNMKDQYDIERYTMVLYKIIKKIDGEAAGNNYLQEHILLPEFREIIVKDLIVQKEYKKAKSILLEGIQINKEQRRIVHNWKEQLVVIAQTENNRSDILKWARELYIKHSDHKKQYSVLKSQYASEDWQVEVNALIVALEKESRNSSSEICRVLNIENRIDDLYKYIIFQKTSNFYFHTHINLLQSFESSLKEEYSAEIIHEYTEHVYDNLQRNTGRTHYKDACKMILKIKNLKGDVKTIAANLRDLHKRKPALLDELSKIYL
ncbi:hypothetical protein IMCC3317_30510 [Kordia antarctica]|uniref:SWIM-type domain-containing protein n=1 Tax=Kordia antarctica TaxID=1218801 RepID=A0A7L4ZMD2_9FLAO|nr:SWIM zinc finger family protein [Kordia antarctica]QHI37670.1 hypothetical protein IMCC3317_30510 [Kordia antarctica]